MGDSTHTLTAHSIDNGDTMQVTVPAQVQREQNICIDTTVEVAIHGISDLIDRASFEGQQTAGDRVTIPAAVSRQLSLDGGEQYDFSFEKVGSDLEEADYAVADEEIEDSVEEEEDDKPDLGELFVDDEEEEVEEEEAEDDSPGLGELFG